MGDAAVSKRPAVPKETETRLLTTSARRCCLCFGLSEDSAERPGQIAHLDRDPTNNEFDNLAWLCLDHHDRYDSRTSQSKGLSISEVKTHRTQLYEFLLQSRRVEGAQPKTVAAALWPPGKWTKAHEDALDFHVSPHRNQAAVLSVSAGPKTLEELNGDIPPHDLEWTRMIVEEVAQKGWLRQNEANPARLELTDRGVHMLHALGEVPEEMKVALWKEIWAPNFGRDEEA